MQKWLLSTPITAILSSKLLTIKHLKQLKTSPDYCREGFYNNTIFHRVINGFMIQGGGFEPGMKQKATKEPIKNEANNGLKKYPWYAGNGTYSGSALCNCTVLHQRG